MNILVGVSEIGISDERCQPREFRARGLTTNQVDDLTGNLSKLRRRPIPEVPDAIAKLLAESAGVVPGLSLEIEEVFLR